MGVLVFMLFVNAAELSWEKRSPVSRRWSIFVITSALFFLSQFYRASNAVIAPQLMQDLSLDTKDLGLLSATFFYAFAVTQIPISVLLDRIGPRIMMTGLSLIGVAGAIIFALADSLGMGLVGRALLGIGMACNLMGTFKLLTLWFGPLSFATLSGTIFAIGSVGNIAATSPLVLLVQYMGWRWTYCLIAGITLLLTLALYIIVRDSPEQNPFGPSQKDAASFGKALSDLRVLLKMKDFWVISFGTFVSYGIFASFRPCGRARTLWKSSVFLLSMQEILFFS